MNMKNPQEAVAISFVFPCLDEEQTIESCILDAKIGLQKIGLPYEIIVADNGSVDNSVELAQRQGATVTHVLSKGYGHALRAGCDSARGDIIFMADADGSYDATELCSFKEEFDKGADIVIGNRFSGTIEPGAMPWKNRYIGNPFLSFVARTLFSSQVRDYHCGIRAITKRMFNALNLRCGGMEFASEMIIKGHFFEAKLAEVPTSLKKDGRDRPPHLRPWRDGWRHLRYIILFSPRKLFFFPGIVLSAVSAAFYTRLLFGELNVLVAELDVRALLFFQLGFSFGLMFAALGIVIELISARDGLFPSSELVNNVKRQPLLEAGLVFGGGLILVGTVMAFLSIYFWAIQDFGVLENIAIFRIVSLSTLSITVGGILLCFGIIAGFVSVVEE